MKVLFTGASGFIGSGVLSHLLENTYWDFTCISSWRHHGNPYNVSIDERVRVVTHDLVGPLPDMGQFDMILHLASESHVDRSIADPVGFIENNVSSTLQVLEYARKYPPSVFLLFSSDEVYGATEHEEWDILLPSNPYSASKAAQEMIAIAYWNTYKVPVVITNSNNIVGPNQDKEKFLPKLINLIGKGEKVTIHVSNGKPGKRYYNPVENVADALQWIIAPDYKYMYSLDEGVIDRPRRYNIPGGEELDNLQLAQLIAELMGRTLNYELVDVSTVRPAYDEFYARTDGLLGTEGWKPPVTLREALPAIIKSYEE